ncbi:MAG: hypothetical protein ACE5JP_05395 [Candidatus Bipolaricaulia bacterium]
MTLSLIDPDNPYRRLEVRGRIAKITEEGADAHIDSLAKKYVGTERFTGRPGEIRILYKIEPEHVTYMG